MAPAISDGLMVTTLPAEHVDAAGLPIEESITR